MSEAEIKELKESIKKDIRQSKQEIIIILKCIMIMFIFSITFVLIISIFR